MNFATQKVEMQRRADGTILLRSPQKLGPYARCVTEWLVQWSDKAPDRTFLAERDGDRWKKLTYRETYGAVRRVAQALLDRGLGPERPVAILSDNGLDHALLALGAMHVGIPVAPVSPAYSLMSQDFGKLKYIFELVQPGLVFAADAQKFAPAGSGWPQWLHAATGREPGAGRPQWEQKCTPEGSGAPHSQRGRGRRGPRVAASEAVRSASSSFSRCSIRRTSPARSMRSSGRKRSRRTISTARPPTS